MTGVQTFALPICLLKGGLTLDEWDMTDNGAGTFLTIVSLISLCSCLFCIVYMLQIIVKGTAARILRKVVGFNGYLNIVIGMFITIMVQSSSFTTSTLTPLAAVGLIGLEEAEKARGSDHESVAGVLVNVSNAYGRLGDAAELADARGEGVQRG